jgi:hypothetical protein
MRAWVVTALVLGAPFPIAAGEDGYVSPTEMAPVSGERRAPSAGSAGESPSLEMTITEASRDGAIPWDKLDDEGYRLVREVIAAPTVSHEVRGIAFRSRPAVFEFLLDHPEFAAEVARIVRQGKYIVRRVDDGYEAEDGLGSRGTFRTLFADGGRRVFHVSGRYDRPYLPTLSGRLVVLLDAEHVDGADGETYCHLRLAGHLRLDSALADAVVPVVLRLGEAKLDREVRRFLRHVASVSRRAYDDPRGLADELDRRDEVPRATLATFRTLLLAHLPPDWAEPLGLSLLGPPGLSLVDPAAMPPRPE